MQRLLKINKKITRAPERLMPKTIKPRKPFLLRSPPQYYEDHQLASVILSVGTMLTALSFNQYPQAFITLYGGIEKLCKNVAKIDKRQNFWFKE